MASGFFLLWPNFDPFQFSTISSLLFLFLFPNSSSFKDQNKQVIFLHLNRTKLEEFRNFCSEYNRQMTRSWGEGGGGNCRSLFGSLGAENKDSGQQPEKHEDFTPQL